MKPIAIRQDVPLMHSRGAAPTPQRSVAFGLHRCGAKEGDRETFTSYGLRVPRQHSSHAPTSPCATVCLCPFSAGCNTAYRTAYPLYITRPS